MLEKHKYPFPKTEDIGSIEYVVTNSKFRNQGVASTIIKHIIGDTPHTTYVLEVADNNIPVIKCYQKLGFTDFLTVPNKNSKAAGFNNFLYMKYLKEEAN